MDSSKVYRKEPGKIYHLDKRILKSERNIHHKMYRDGNKQEHHANLHFVMNGKIVETIEHDVSFSWANSRKKELKQTIPYCYGILVVVSIYAKDQIFGGKRESSRAGK